MSLKKFCAWQGCNEAVNVGQTYCPKHQAMHEDIMRKKQSSYDKTIRYKRDRKYHMFYCSTEWEQMKLYIKNRYKGLCLYSYFVGHEIVMADEVHHIIPIKADFTQRLNINNLIPLNFAIHKKVEARYKHSKLERLSTQEQLRELLQKWNKEMCQRVGG